MSLSKYKLTRVAGEFTSALVMVGIVGIAGVANAEHAVKSFLRSDSGGRCVHLVTLREATAELLR